jgi:molybdenum cofactor cytidylyltransferase
MNSGLYWRIRSSLTIAKWIAAVKPREVAFRVDTQHAPGAEEVDCIVPAAGRSRRMGSWKPLIPFEGSSIIERVVAQAREVCSRVILVTGYRGGELEAAFRGRPGVSVVENPDWPLGMFSSIQRGVEQVSAPRFFVTLGDMPRIRPDVYGALLRAPGADVVFPVFDGARGHPVLFADTVRDAILRADPSKGSMREIAAGFRIGELSWTDDTILRDIDTLQDLEA